MCEIDMLDGCETQQIPNAGTKKHAFTPCTKACRKRKKLLPRCCSSRTIQHCLTSGPFSTGWRLRRAAQCLAVRSDRLAMRKVTKFAPARRAAQDFKRSPEPTGDGPVTAVYAC